MAVQLPFDSPVTAAPEPSSATILLSRVGAGDRAAAAALFELLYGELRSRAQALVRDGAGITLQPTALVHEAWLKLVPGRQATVRDRSHFLRLAAAAMRSILVDHARARRADKRGGGARRLALDDFCAVLTERAIDLIALDEALARLAAFDPMSAQIVELRFFAGLEVAVVAEALSVSASTVERAWRTARAWLRAELETP